MSGHTTKADETPAFIEFWSAWRPFARHTDGRGDARDAFFKHVKAGADPQDIADGAKWFLHTMKEKDKEYIPLAATWIGRRSYEDQAEEYRAYEARRQERQLAQTANVVPISQQVPAERRAELAAQARARLGSAKMGA